MTTTTTSGTSRCRQGSQGLAAPRDDDNDVGDKKQVDQLDTEVAATQVVIDIATTSGAGELEVTGAAGDNDEAGEEQVEGTDTVRATSVPTGSIIISGSIDGPFGSIGDIAAKATAAVADVATAPLDESTEAGRLEQVAAAAVADATGLGEEDVGTEAREVPDAVDDQVAAVSGDDVVDDAPLINEAVVVTKEDIGSAQEATTRH